MLDLARAAGRTGPRRARRAMVLALARARAAGRAARRGASGTANPSLLRLDPPCRSTRPSSSCARPAADASARSRPRGSPIVPAAIPSSSSRPPACCCRARTARRPPPAPRCRPPSRRWSPPGWTALPPRAPGARAPRLGLLRLVRPPRARRHRPRRHHRRAPQARGRRDRRAARTAAVAEDALAAAALHAEGRRVCERAQARARRPAPVDRRRPASRAGTLLGRRASRARGAGVAGPRSGWTGPSAEPAADALLGAGDRARRRMESRSAIDYYERALAMARPRGGWGVREARALAGMGEAHYWLGEYPAAHRGAGARGGARRRARRRLDARARAPVPGRHRDQRRGRPRPARRSCSTGRSPPPRSSANPSAIAARCCSPGWVPWTRGDTAEAEAIWRGRWRSPNTTTAGRGCARSTRCRSTSPAPPERRSARGRGGGAPADRGGAARSPRRWATSSASPSRPCSGRGVLEDLGRLEESLPCFGAPSRPSTSWARGGSTPTPWPSAASPARARAGSTRPRRTSGTRSRISEELGERQLASWTWRALGRVSELRGDHAEAERQARRSRDAEEQFERSRS